MLLTRNLVPVLSAALLLLSACSDTDTDTVPQTDSNIVQGDTSATPSLPSSDWTVTVEGVGPVRIGMSLAELRGAVELEATEIDSTASCFHVRPRNAPAGLLVMISGGRVARVEVTEAGITTGEGAAVGDEPGRIRQLYPGTVTEQPHKYTDGKYLIVTPQTPERRIIFETDSTRVTRFRVGKTPEVEWVEGCS